MSSYQYQMSSNNIKLFLHNNIVLPYHNKYETNKLLYFLKKEKINKDLQRLNVSDIQKIYTQYGQDIFYSIYHQFFWIPTKRKYFNNFGIIVCPKDAESAWSLGGFVNTLRIAMFNDTWIGNVTMQSILTASNIPKIGYIFKNNVENGIYFHMVIDKDDFEKYMLWYHPKTVITIINNKGCWFCNAYHKGYKLCKKCKKAAYCSRKCQKKDWKNKHRYICKR